MGKKHPPKSSQSGLTNTDKRVWAEVTKTIKPLPQNATHAETMAELLGDTYPKNPPKIHQNPITPSKLEQLSQSVGDVLTKIGQTNPDFTPTVTLTPAQNLAHGDTTHMHKSQGKRFLRGQIPIESKLDLHGMTQDTAHAQLNQFVKTAFNRGYRKIIVVTGKGSGILQNAVPKWLNDTTLRPYILSYAYAQPQDGGQGALYVLLKRNRTKS